MPFYKKINENWTKITHKKVAPKSGMGVIALDDAATEPASDFFKINDKGNQIANFDKPYDVRAIDDLFNQSFAVGTNNNGVVKYDSSNNTEEWQAGTSETKSIKFGPNNNIGAGVGSAIVLFDQNGNQLLTKAQGLPIKSVCFDSNGNIFGLYSNNLAGYKPDGTQIFDAVTNAQIGANQNDIVESGGTLVVTSPTSYEKFDISTGNSINVKDISFDVGSARDAELIDNDLYLASNNNGLCQIDISTDTIEKKVETNQSIRSVTADGSEVAFCSQSGSVYKYDRNLSNKIWTKTVSSQELNHVVYFPSGYIQ